MSDSPTTPKRGRVKQRPSAGRRMVSMRLDESTLDYATDNFASPTGGAAWLIEWAGVALPRALARAARQLSREELLALVDLHNAHYLMPQLCGPDHLALMVRDAELDGMAAKWGYETEALASRLEGLGQIEATALAIWACAYWQAGHYRTVKPEAYVDSLLAG
jgi:hypothetical protein